MSPYQQAISDLEARLWSWAALPLPSGHRVTAWETPAFHLLWCHGVASPAQPSCAQLWETRKGRQGYLVILLAPTGDEGPVCKVLGPQQAQPVRELPMGRTIHLLQQARTMVVREAATFLAGEFQRLEEAVVPGLEGKERSPNQPSSLPVPPARHQTTSLMTELS